jgi:hypothetical protein
MNAQATPRRNVSRIEKQTRLTAYYTKLVEKHGVQKVIAHLVAAIAELQTERAKGETV